MIGSSQNKKKTTNARLVASGCVAFLTLASIPEFTFAHRRYGSCGRSYRHSYPSRYGSCGWGGCGSNWYSPWRPYNAAIDIFDNLVYGSMNSLARRQRPKSVAVDVERKSPGYSIEDYGRNGLELTVEVPGLKAKDIDLEIFQNDDGANTIAVSGSPGIRRRSSSAVSRKFTQSFVVNDDAIDVDGITATFSSGILRISLPRKMRGDRKRVIPSVFRNGSFDDDSKNGDKILVFDSKRGIRKGAKRKRRSARKSLTTKEVESTSIKNDGQSQEEDDFYISEAEDIW